MLAYVEGRVLEVGENGCVLLTAGGVGYEVFLPTHALAHLPEKGAQAAFFTCFVVREDAQELFGFPTWDDRQTFLVLIGITRVGARTALAILSQFRPDDLRRIVPLRTGSGIVADASTGAVTDPAVAQRDLLRVVPRLPRPAQELVAQPVGIPVPAWRRRK